MHRAGEGASFTGLKPAGRDLGPAIPAADNAITDETVDSVLHLLTGSGEKRVRDSFDAVQQKKHYNKIDLEKGREFVKAYVAYIHLVEGIYQQATSANEGHFDDSQIREHRPSQSNAEETAK